MNKPIDCGLLEVDKLLSIVFMKDITREQMKEMIDRVFLEAAIRQKEEQIK